METVFGPIVRSGKFWSWGKLYFLHFLFYLVKFRTFPYNSNWQTSEGKGGGGGRIIYIYQRVRIYAQTYILHLIWNSGKHHRNLECFPSCTWGTWVHPFQRQSLKQLSKCIMWHINLLEPILLFDRNCGCCGRSHPDTENGKLWTSLHQD